MVKLTPSGAHITELTRAVYRLNGLFLKAGNRIAAPAGLGSAHWQILGIVEHGPVPVAHVARIWGLTRQAVQQTANALMRDGLIEAVENPHHRRAKLLDITPHGVTALKQIRAQQAAWANAVGDNHDAEDLKSVVAELGKLATTLETHAGRGKAKAAKPSRKSQPLDRSAS